MLSMRGLIRRDLSSNIVDQLADSACKNFTDALDLIIVIMNIILLFNNKDNAACVDAYYACLYSEQCRKHKSSDSNSLLKIQPSEHMLTKVKLSNLNESRLIKLLLGMNNLN